MKCVTILVFLFLCVVQLCISLKIMGIMPIQGRSHYYPFQALMEGLAEKGHQVTFVTPFTPTTPIPNLEYYTLAEDLSIPRGELFSFNEENRVFGGAQINEISIKLFALWAIHNISKVTCDVLLNSKKMQVFRKQHNYFDLVIVESFHTDCWFPFAWEYQAPLVHFTASFPMPWYNDRFGQPSNPSYIPSMFTGFSMEMNFWERMQNMMFDVFQKYYYDHIQEPTNDEFAKRFFGDSKPDRDVIAKNASLLLINTHFSIQGARPFVPGLIEVGGIHLKKGPRKVPQVSADNIYTHL